MTAPEDQQEEAMTTPEKKKEEEERPYLRQRSYHAAVAKEEEAAGGSSQTKGEEARVPQLPSAPEDHFTKPQGWVKPAENSANSEKRPRDWVKQAGVQRLAGEILGLSDVPQEVFNKEVESDLLAGTIKQGDKGANDDDDPDQTVDWLADQEDFQRPAKLDLIVGFIRLFSFISVCTSVFAVILSILFPIQQTETVILNIWQTVNFQEDGVNDTFKVLEGVVRPNPLYPTRDLLFYLRCIAGVIQLAYLFVNAAFVIIDSIGTVTFRWKEYGELTHRHTDATSIMFLVSKSRWKQRFLCGLTVASATSLQTAQIILRYYGQGPEGAKHRSIPEKSVHAVIWYLAMMMLGLVGSCLGYILFLIPADWRDVPWLDNYQTDKHIDDKDDRWKSFKDLALYKRSRREEELESVSSVLPLKHGAENEEPSSFSTISGEVSKNSVKTKVLHSYKELTCFGFMLETQKRVVYFVAYVLSITMNLYTLLLIDLKPESFEFWTCLISTVCTSAMSLGLVILVCIQCFRLPPQSTPFLSKIFVPFTLSCSLRMLLDVDLAPSQQYFFGYIYIVLLVLYILLHLVGMLTRRWAIEEPINNFIIKFLKFNFWTSEGAYKKWTRLFDTLGGFFGLVGLILGIFSLLCDQYDLEFELEGDLKVVMDGFQKFYGEMKSVVDQVNKVIKSIDFDVTCKDIYGVIGGTLGLGAFISFIPGELIQT